MNNKIGGLIFQYLLQGYSDQSLAVLIKDRHIDQWDGIESLEINPHT